MGQKLEKLISIAEKRKNFNSAVFWDTQDWDLIVNTFYEGKKIDTKHLTMFSVFQLKEKKKLTIFKHPKKVKWKIYLTH